MVDMYHKLSVSFLFRGSVVILLSVSVEAVTRESLNIQVFWYVILCIVVSCVVRNCFFSYSWLRAS